MIEDCPEYIIKHRTSEEGEVQYYVKWIGCDILDNTWESRDKLLAEWPFAIKNYERDIKNRAVPKPYEAKADDDQVFQYTRSVTDWEAAVDCITYVEKSKLPGLVVYVKWKNGFKSVHHSTEVYSKCPQKMLDYFEQFRKFRPIDHD